MRVHISSVCFLIPFVFSRISLMASDGTKYLSIILSLFFSLSYFFELIPTCLDEILSLFYASQHFVEICEALFLDDVSRCFNISFGVYSFFYFCWLNSQHAYIVHRFGTSIKYNIIWLSGVSNLIGRFIRNSYMCFLKGSKAKEWIFILFW